MPNQLVHDFNSSTKFAEPAKLKKPASVSIYDQVYSKFSTNNISSTVVD